MKKYIKEYSRPFRRRTMQTNRKNIILDFMDPENRILYGSYKNLDSTEHVRLLTESLNLAVLLCDEYCIIPPCAIMQCTYVRKTLENSNHYLDEGLIRFPVRESTLDQFIEKKKVNYSQDKDAENYAEFFKSGGPTLLKKHAAAIIRRETRVGKAVAEMVAATPFDNPLWENLKKRYSHSELTKIQLAPRALIENDEAVSVTGIKRLTNLKCGEDVEFEIGRILQNKYFYIYIYEYDGRIIHGIPPKTTDFLIEHFGPSYEYSYWKYILKSLGLYRCIRKSDSLAICEIRDIPNCYDFIDTLMYFGDCVGSVSNAKRLFPQVLKKIKELDSSFKVRTLESFNEENPISDETSEYLYQLFDVVSRAVAQVTNNVSTTINNTEQPVKLEEQDYNQIVKKNVISKPLQKCDSTKPFVFLAYSQNETEEVVYKDCVLLGRMGINYWVDKANMVGTNKDAPGWRDIANKALQKCVLYVPYITDSFFDSSSCCEEVKAFLETNTEAGIILLIGKGYSIDKAIRRILTYNNILQGDVAQNMIKLFQVNQDKSKKDYIVDQLYRNCNENYFEYFINDALFYNTFMKYGLIDSVKYPNHETWYTQGVKEMENVSFE